MKKIILKVIEGRGKSGEAKKGQKRFLFTDGTIEAFNIFCHNYHNEYIKLFPKGKLTYKEIRLQWVKLVLFYQDVEIMEYECKSLNTTLIIGNITKLRNTPYLDIDKTLLNIKFS